MENDQIIDENTFDDNNDDKTDQDEDQEAEFEIKKELSDDFNNDLISTPSDGIFEVIPFMAKLLSNVKCSFYSRHDEIIIAGVEFASVVDLIDRLIKSKITPCKVTCGLDTSFTLSISEAEFHRPLRLFNSENARILRFLPLMGLATQSTNLSIQIDRGEFLVRSISYESLANLMSRLKQFDIRPKRVDSLRDSAFSLVFNQQSFNINNSNNFLKLLSINESINNYNNDNFIPGVNYSGGSGIGSLRRARNCPNYLRDYVIGKKDESVSGNNVMNSNSSISGGDDCFNNSDSCCDTPLGLSSHRSDGSPNIVKRARGRPRMRPLPVERTEDCFAVKRPRGRPRRSDVIPNIVARASTNSFINIQPKSMTAEELESCFVKFLESDMCNSNKDN